MTISAFEARTFLVQLLSAAARTVVLAAIAGLLLTALRVRTTRVQLFSWMAVLYAGLCMPILGGMLPSVEVPVPFGRPAPTKLLNRAGASVATVVPRTHPLTIHAEEIRSATDSAPSHEMTNHMGQMEHFSWSAWAASVPWAMVGVCTYFAIALLLLARLVIGIAFARGLVRSSIPIDDPRVTQRLALRPYLSRRPPLPQVRESRSASVPLTVGIFTPTIILPSSWRQWDNDRLTGVLTHEMSHVARRDCLSQSASLLHRAIFWFSPLAWWLNRHIIELAEQASDEEVLSRGADQNRYARMLLGFLENLRGTPGRIRWQGVAMASSSRAEKRLEKILAWRGDTKMRTNKSTLVVVLAVTIPASLLVAASRPAGPSQSGASSGTPQSGAAAPAAPTSSAPAPGPAMSSAPATPAATAAPRSPGTPEAPEDRVFAENHHHGFSYRYGDDDEQRFVIVSGKTDAFTMSGSGQDARHAERLKQRIPGDFIWFQRDEKSYIIRDQATVDRARQLWAPQEELGKKQAELGKQQEVLGKQQQELGARMEAVRVKVPDISAELDKLKAEMKQLGPDATVEQIGRIQSEIGRLQSRIGEIQSHAGEEQGKLGDEMGVLGEKQGKLGQQQGELGRQQGELAEKAIQEMRRLLDDAIKKGTAQPENPEPGGASL
jgi:beta-lactamase regulating signal transducer with metallopeptidase domain